MGLSVRRRGGATLAGIAALVMAGGAVGCGAEKQDGASGSARTVQQVLTAAFERTAEVKSAKVEMTMSMPAALDGGGDMTMSGVMGWDPTVMDLTMKGSAFSTQPGAPEQVRMVWQDNVMYMDMGAEAAKDMDGKRWMKLDLAAAAEAAGDEDLTKQMTSGLDNMNQNPTEQLAMLRESPNLKHVGSEKIDGVEAEHYTGTLTVKEMMESNDTLDLLEPEERKQLLDNIEKSGIKGYDTDVWVNEDDLPVRMDITMETPEGDVDMSMKLSDYGAKAEVELPPAGETVDLFEMLQGAGEMAGSEGAFDEEAFEKEMAELEALESGV
ncbi:hypothetical protein GCM10010145_36290 [Streptomyces ruber]|uniref:Lipoprotein n=2 Tax=Streptomyces TaxID=1883 RepID=A0A918BEJ3_9ACTN|nr:hypothetical protein [Streptomyces ruber]GGQ63110.1 hypothetical protein GCM10010145_36290 [Streptomyces ruber]